MLGDIFDVEQCDILDILDRYKELIQTMVYGYKYGCLKLICGNHDIKLYEPLKSIGIETARIVVINSLAGDYGILLMHGHQFDHLCKNDTLFQRTVIKVSGYLEHIIPKIDAINPNLLQRNKPELCYDEAIKYAIQRNISAVVMGHTHRLKIITTNSLVKVYNTGCCTNSHMDYIFENSDGVWSGMSVNNSIG